MEASLVIATCIVLAMIIMVPKALWKRLTGYRMAMDAAASSYAVWVGAGTGTVTGLSAGFIAAIGISIFLHVARARYGASRLALNGETSISKIASGLLTQASSWVRSTFKALFTGSPVQAPASLDWTWVEVQPAHTWAELVRSFISAPFTAA